ncbi:4Fe-4S dicluster domain-containing protein [Parasulfuritortus cantonensis]|uniref:4Fe-4S dicluster domain-containing protein n=1 Tax=Parasulfuritortus cantonensis TaxID=2528202 RepID=A0A4R1BN07_9PROT|nr:FAD-dependent oxidoreductase [Parasulfuritortus cantonensis]TCJ18930.1 4Fe-4S dicluster domain-containing protein [Parasulfuritortus cantonensis]
MSDIDYKAKGSILNPLRTLSFFARKPVTMPLAPRVAAERYRGFHLNDWDKCVGCSTCQKVCDNAAITMVRVPGLPNDPVKGVRDMRPAIDYGRCCWCALCVDLCPTGSITLSREYVHTCTDDQLSSYFILPDPKGIHGQFLGQGWRKEADNDLVDHARQAMGEMTPAARIGNFAEMVNGYDRQQAILEASRCVQCGMCHDACPTHMHAPEYIRAIWQDDVEEAVRQIYRTNPFAHTCGRVCTHKCEDACSIGHTGEPIAIRWLKRYAMDSLAPERVAAIVAEQGKAAPSGRRVAIVGAGPAGLTAAFDLAMAGHRVIVYEALAQAGGMTRYGIPDYRLPQAMLDRDVAVITGLGVEIRYGVRIGTDVSMAELRRDHDAVLLAIGLQYGRSTRIPGSEHADVYRAVDLLREVSAGNPLDVPKQVLVIGGGNVAMDIARSLARLQKIRYGEVGVTVTALQALGEFPADREEIVEAGEEDIVILPSRGPQNVAIEDGKVIGLRTAAVVSLRDAEGRFAPTYDLDDVQFHPGSWVIEAIGQLSDAEAVLGSEVSEQVEWRRGRLATDANGRTSAPWLWTAGDVANGPDVVHAVADGHRVAADMHRFLNTLAEVMA